MNDALLPGKVSKLQVMGDRTKTNTGRQDENSKARKRTRMKELGKIAP